MENIIFHIDVNSAFLSWSAVDMLNNGSNIDIRTIPSIIGGDQSKRHGIVLAKSVPAKAYGIVTGEPIINAQKKCPNLTIVPPNHALYQEKSRLMMDYLKTLTSDIEQVSIDECFLWFTPIAQNYPSPLAAAAQIKDTIYETFGFTVNIGISDKKVLAKMASDFQKPNLVHTLFCSEIRQKMWNLPVSDLFGCGHSSVQVLKTLEIYTIGDLANADPSIIKAHLKSHGILLWQYANGIDDSRVEPLPQAAKGIGNSHTLKKDATTKEEAYSTLLHLSDSVSERLRKSGVSASMVSVEIKDASFRTMSHQCSLKTPTHSGKLIYETACQLFDELWDYTPIRLLGIRTTKLTDVSEPIQMNLFDFLDKSPKEQIGEHQSKKQAALEDALDKIRGKYGKDAVIRGNQL